MKTPPTIITATLVAKLREKTHASIMECKKALIEAQGVLIVAEEILYKKLGRQVCKASTRIAAEGIVQAYITNKQDIGVLIELNSETDFVARHSEFIIFATDIAKLISKYNPSDLNELAILQLEDGTTVEEKRRNLIGRLGENICIRRFRYLKTSYKFASYVHNNRIGAIVEFDGINPDIGQDIAMHVVAMQPIAVSSNQIPVDLINRERAAAKLKASKLGKSAEIVNKIINGFVEKYIKQVSLLNQAFVKDEEKTVQQILDVTQTIIKSFAIFIVGSEVKK